MAAWRFTGSRADASALSSTALAPGMLGVYDWVGRLLHTGWAQLWHDMASTGLLYLDISFRSCLFWRISLLLPGFTPSLVVFVMAIACT